MVDDQGGGFHEKLLEKSPLEAGGRASRLPDDPERMLRSIFYDKNPGLHSPEMMDELADFHLKAKGFTETRRAKHLTDLQRLASKRDDLEKKLRQAKKEQDRGEIDRLEHELDQNDQLLRHNVRGVKEAPPNEVILDDDDMRYLVKKVVPPGMHGFFEKYCELEYDGSLTADEIQITNEGKLVFRFGPGLLKPEIKDGKPLVKLDKLIFQVARMVGSLIQEPRVWQDYKNRVSILKTRAPTWENFVALYLTDPTSANQIAPEAADAVKRSIENLKVLSEADPSLKGALNRPTETKQFDAKFEFDQVRRLGMAGLMGRALLVGERMRTLGAVLTEARDRVMAAFKELVPYKQTDWYERALAEFEDKEKSRILVRDEHVTDRHRRLKTFFETGDEFGARTLILSMSETGDSRWWVYHAYLNAFDPLYRKTNGEEITGDSYSFVVRCLRISQKKRREGTKPGNYFPFEPVVEGGRWRFKRGANDVWEDNTFDELDKKSFRNVMACEQEAFEWMEIVRQHRFMEIDELFDNEYTPLAFREEFKKYRASHKLGYDIKPSWNSKEDPWLEETNDLRKLFGEPFAKQLMERVNHPRRLGDAREGWSKLDPDQKMIIARFIAAGWAYEEAERTGLKPRGNPLASEHAKTVQKRVLEFYGSRIRAYEQYLKEGGTPIAAYDRMMHAVQRYKETELAIYRSAKEAKEEKPEEARAQAIMSSEPVVSLLDDPSQTEEKIKVVQEVRDYADKGLFESEKGMITQLNLSKPFKDYLVRELKQDPRRIRNYLISLADEEDLRSLVHKLYDLNEKQAIDGGPEAYAGYVDQLRSYAAITQRDLDTIRKFFRQHKAEFDQYLGTTEWLEEITAFQQKLTADLAGVETEAKKKWLNDRKETLERTIKADFLVTQRSGPPMPQYSYVYQGKPLVEDTEYRQINRDLGLPDDRDLEETALYRMISTKRPAEARAGALGMRVDLLPPEHIVTEQDRPRWLAVKARLALAAVMLEQTQTPAQKKNRRDENEAETAPYPELLGEEGD